MVYTRKSIYCNLSDFEEQEVWIWNVSYCIKKPSKGWNWQQGFWRSKVHRTLSIHQLTQWPWDAITPSPSSNIVGKQKKRWSKQGKMHKQGEKSKKNVPFWRAWVRRLDSGKKNQGHTGLAYDDYDLWQHYNGRKSIYILKVRFFSD